MMVSKCTVRPTKSAFSDSQLLFRFVLKGTLIQIWKSASIFVFTWKYYVEDFPLKHLLLFEICLRQTREKFVYKHSEIECLKLACFLKNLQTSRANNSRIVRIHNAKFWEYCFYMNSNMKRDFQICISVPLIVRFCEAFTF